MTSPNVPQPAADDPVDEQIVAWKGPSGRAWVRKQAVLDEMFAPLAAFLVDTVTADAPDARRVLDVGCGAGATTLAVAAAIGAQGGWAVGLDISEPLLTLARSRADAEGVPARFVQADIQDGPVADGAFDAVISRFGVMFFRAPVAAFTNLRLAAAPGAALRMLTWREPDANPFMTTGETAVAPLLGLPIREPDTPGPFGLAGRDYALSVLERSGWSAADAQPIDIECRFPESELTGYLTSIGPVAPRLAQLPDDERARMVDIVRAAYEPFVEGDTVRFVAAGWLLSATNDGR
ncbi:class I SAM-dependent methyltransferase [Millisia brevis]|uniref:class I SAM-dependent methyltransferase n=1 Tax=Millisia brevis TaxID=264148 RepID=UPI00082D98D8|nr:class I SAM-dependent methyltransferase [Millisia brevis]